MRAMAEVLAGEGYSEDQRSESVPESRKLVRPDAAVAEAASVSFADPTPLGLIGLAIACAALLPIAFGTSLTPRAFETAAVFAILFGGGCQLLAGILNFSNKNLLGATLFTAFAFNWALNAWVLWSLAHGVAPEHHVVLATEAASLAVFVPLTYAFGFYSKLLFAFLLDIDLLYVAKLLRGYAGVPHMELPIALFTLGLGLIALWIALAMLVNPAAGRPIFPVSGRLFTPRPRAG